jgi:membrane protease YdiL (CAAX protease family)
LIGQDFRSVPGWAVLLFLAALPAIGFSAYHFWPDRSMMSLLGGFFVVALASLVVAVAPLGQAAFPALAIRPASLRWTVLGVLGTIVLSISVSRIGPEAEGIQDAMRVVREPRSFLLSLAVLAFLAPLVEELVFRGLLYGWLEGRWGRSVALVVSSLAFAGAHIEPAHMLLVLPLGVLFGWLRLRTGSVVPSIVSHMANNAMAVLAGAFAAAD